MLQKVLLGLTVLMAGIYIAGGLSFIVGYVSGSMDWEPSVLEAMIFGAIPIAAGPMVLSGLYMIKRSPRLGPGLVAIGAVAVTATWFWMFFIFAPISIIVIAFAIVRARRFSQERDRIALI